MSSMDQLVCFCKKITRGDIKKAQEEGALTYEEVKEKTTAGSGCGRCKIAIETAMNE